MSFTISQAAGLIGCPAPTIRYYERSGLLPPARRAANGYRCYEAEDVQRLQFVVRARALGFALSDIAELLELSDHPRRPCAAVDEKVALQLGQVRARIQRLTELAARLERLQAACDGAHAMEDCRILAALADHDVPSAF